MASRSCKHCIIFSYRLPESAFLSADNVVCGAAYCGGLCLPALGDGKALFLVGDGVLDLLEAYRQGVVVKRCLHRV